jgi:high-affinity nickel-transport protein
LPWPSVSGIGSTRWLATVKLAGSSSNTRDGRRLVLAGTGSADGLPWYAILCLPVLFAAGMSLLDSIDGSFMNFAYGWAFSNPVRKVYYNITVTGLSVVVALLIGSVEVLGLIGQEYRLGGSFWSWVDGINLNTLGFMIVGLFVITWLAAVTIWRAAGIERRFAPSLGSDVVPGPRGG